MSTAPRSLRKSALSLSMGLCLASLVAAPAFAQSATGAVAGRANGGDQITVVNTATGASRSVTVNSDGSYRIGQLPPGDYTLTAGSGAPVNVNVSLGGTTTVNLGSEGGVANLAAVEVVGSRVVNRVDVHSTESATNITREEIARLPIDQTLTSVALLAPGVVSGNSSLGGISFGGSSIAENSVFINGLNVTDFYRRQSFSSAPFAFFQEFQVKTGGYSVEFGRSTGGVINAVTRRGTNEFTGGIQLTFEPAAWREAPEDRFYENGAVNVLGSQDSSSWMKANVWASGPLVKDKLFLFAMYEQRQGDSRATNAQGNTWFQGESDNGFWGAKLDWQITDDHLLELLAFSDEGDSTSESYQYTFASATRGNFNGLTTSESGGKNGSISYTGQFGENFTAKAMYGLNRTRSIAFSPADELCSQVVIGSTYNATWVGMGRPTVSCHPSASTSVVRHQDERKVARLDFEWTLGSHLLRFGIDHEEMNTDRITYYPGEEGVRYTITTQKAGDVLSNGAQVPVGVTAVVTGRERRDGGAFETSASAFYLEDVWSVTDTLMLNLGVRFDTIENKDAAGQTFIKQDKLFSPRLGFSWDVKGDGSSKLFGNLGRYYLPVPSIINYTFAGGLTDEYSYYALNGWAPATNPITGAPYLAPVIGAQIGGVDDALNISAADTRQSVDRDLSAVYQDEAILGFQTMINTAWSWGVSATYRRMPNDFGDMRINALCGVRHGNLWPIANPGEELTLWGTTAQGCAQNGWVTIDTSKEGYMMAGSNKIIGYKDPKRTYKAVEFQLDRAWDDKWAFNASYTWSRLEGNHEGPVNSDTNYGDTGMAQHWDHPANNERYGVLFNDHEHQVKLRGSYKLNEMWSFGATLTAMSGAPVSAFGVAWPGESGTVASTTSVGSGGGSGWLCVANCTGAWQDRQFEYSPRGAFGRMPWTYNLGANVTMALPIEDIDLKVRFSVFNLLDEQQTINVSQRYEAQPGERRSTFGTGTRWQSPRYMQLVVTWNF